MAAIVISIALQKGGVGKSTTAQALASTLGYNGHRALLIDMDSQANVTYASGCDNPTYTITDVLSENCTADAAIIPCSHYDLIAADEYLTNVELEDVTATLLRGSINPILDKYDYIIIDTPPALGNLSVNALTASDYVVIPAEPRPYAMQGLGALYKTIQTVQTMFQPTLRILGIVLVRYNARTVLTKELKDMINDYAAQIDTTLFKTVIRDSIAVPEAQTVRKPLIDYAPKSKPNIDYMALTAEIVQKIGDYTKCRS